MKLGYAILFVIFFNKLYAQSPQWQWAQRGGSGTQPENNYVQFADNIVADTSGNTYVSGIINSPSCSFGDFNNAQWVTTYGLMDIFLAKYDCSGNLQWVDILGSSGEDNPGGLQFGSDGMIYLYGYVGFDTLNVNTPAGVSVFNATLSSLFLAKFNPSGGLEKVKILDQSSTFFPDNPPYKYLQRRTDGNFIIAGGSNGGVLTGAIQIQAGFFLAEIDTGLNVLWGKCIANAAIVNAIPTFSMFSVDGNNNIVFAGEIDNDSVIFGGQILTINPGAIATAIVMKFDTAANYLWHRKGNAPAGDAAYAPTFDTHNNIIVFVASEKGDTVLGLPFDYTGNSIYEPAFVKLSGTDGSFKFGIVANNVSTLDFSGGIDLQYGLDHNLYFVYQLNGNVIFDSISVTTAVGDAQPLIWEFKDEDTAFRATNNYTLADSRSPAGDDANIPYGFTFDRQGNWYLCGSLAGTITTDRDTVAYANGGELTDIFVAKFGLLCGDTNALVPPIAPDSLTSTATGPHTITVTWKSNAQYVQWFRVYRSSDSITWSVIDSTPANITSYIDINVQQSIIYWYKVSAVNTEGESQFSNIDSAEIMPVGLVDLGWGNMEILVQPNPNKGTFILTIASSVDDDVQIIIYNIDGGEVLSQMVSIVPGNNWYAMEMSSAAAGVYIVALSDEKGTIGRGKVVIQH